MNKFIKILLASLACFVLICGACSPMTPDPIFPSEQTNGDKKPDPTPIPGPDDDDHRDDDEDDGHHDDQGDQDDRDEDEDDDQDPVDPVVPDPPTVGDHNGYGWFELPEMTDEDHNGIDDKNSDLYYSHTFRADAKKIRNFSACYSKSKIHPVWVAAPMHKSYTGSVSRTNAYQNDPNIKCTQSAKFDGYTRGHMVGSAERNVSSATNRQAFYYSNIGAQLQTGFNTGGGAWNKLEDLVDSFWGTDTLYQVIGCIFTNFTDKYGSTVNAKTTKNSANGTVQVPTAYYKAMLKVKRGVNKTPDKCSANELQCVAFILSHKSNAGHVPCVKDMYTIQELEKMTGMKYFVNVPNAPKTTFTASDWSSTLK